ncbi:MAG: hypothetical protein QM775_17625 [Pirellulales bacterium]
MSLVEGKLRLETPAGASLICRWSASTPWSIRPGTSRISPAEQVVFETRVREPRAVADLVAKRYGPRFDKSLEPGPLRLGGGLSQGSRPAQPQHRHLAAGGAVREVHGHRGHRRSGPSARQREATIYGDDRVLFERNVQGSDAPVPIALLDLTGVMRLKVTVDFGDRDGIETGDYLDLCDARLYK